MASDSGTPCVKPTSESRAPTEALLFTQNTTRNPISWNPALRQPNPNEVLHSVHLALHRALDPCINGTGESCSWAIDVARKDTISRRVLVIPKLSDLHTPSQEVLEHSEISVKLRFYGLHDDVDRIAQVDEALGNLKAATGFTDIDRFVIGFDSIRWDGGDEETKEYCEQVAYLVESGVWQVVLLPLRYPETEVVLP